jgi:hypothetical protein
MAKDATSEIGNKKHLNKFKGAALERSLNFFRLKKSNCLGLMTGAQASRLHTSRRRVKKLRVYSRLGLIKAFRLAVASLCKRDACAPVLIS